MKLYGCLGDKLDAILKDKNKGTTGKAEDDIYELLKNLSNEKLDNITKDITISRTDDQPKGVWMGAETLTVKLGDKTWGYSGRLF